MNPEPIIKKSLHISLKSKVKNRADRRKTLRYKTKRYVTVEETVTIVYAPDLSHFAEMSKILIKPRDKPRKNFASIIILNYNTLEILWECIESVLLKTRYPYELIVVDNASTDRSVPWLKTQKYLRLIANKQNLGWTKGNNVGIRRARGKHIVLMNSDIIVKADTWLNEMVKCARRRNVGTVGAKLLYPTGRVQHVGGGIHRGNPFHPFDGAPADLPEANVNRDVPFNTGAVLLISRDTLEKVGLLDESYPLGYGDVDYGLKCVEAGLKNVVCHKAVLTHLWAYTQRKTKKWIPPASLYNFRSKWPENLLLKINETVTLDWLWPTSAKWIRTHGPGSHIAVAMKIEAKQRG